MNAPPEKFFNSRVRQAIVCPETALMYAVLEDAFLCFQKQFETEQRFVRRAREAEDWFFSDDSRRLYSFVSVCAALGLEPEYIRTKRKHWIPPWTQRWPRDNISVAPQPPRFREPTINDRPRPLSQQTVVIIIVGIERRHDDDSTDSSSRRVQTTIARFVAARDDKFLRHQDCQTCDRLHLRRNR